MQIRKYSSLGYILDSLQKVNSQNITEAKRVIASPLKSNKWNSAEIINPSKLNRIFLSKDVTNYGHSEITRTSQLFRPKDIKIQWIAGKYSDIPDVKYEIRKAEKQARAELSKAVSYGHSKMDERKPKRTSFGIKPEHLKVLPEVLFLGHTNAGKSSLINTLLVGKGKGINGSSKNSTARVSSTPGFTKTLNCYLVANQLRLIDSPGYGEHGRASEGELVIEYLNKRTCLRRVFIVIDGLIGATEPDIDIIRLLMQEGISFEIIFTKVDKVISKYMSNISSISSIHGGIGSGAKNLKDLIKEKNEAVINHFKHILERDNLFNIPSAPRILFINSFTNKFVTSTYGYNEVRSEILRASSIR